MAEKKDEKKPTTEEVAEFKADLLEAAKATVEAQGKHLEIADQEIQRLNAVVTELQKDASFKDARIDALERKLKAAKSAPTGDVVFLGGKTWAVRGTVMARMALDEVKKGHIPGDVTLVVIDRVE